MVPASTYTRHAAKGIRSSGSLIGAERLPRRARRRSGAVRPAALAAAFFVLSFPPLSAQNLSVRVDSGAVDMGPCSPGVILTSDNRSEFPGFSAYVGWVSGAELPVLMDAVWMLPESGPARVEGIREIIHSIGGHIGWHVVPEYPLFAPGNFVRSLTLPCPAAGYFPVLLLLSRPMSHFDGTDCIGLVTSSDWSGCPALGTITIGFLFGTLRWDVILIGSEGSAAVTLVPVDPAAFPVPAPPQFLSGPAPLSRLPGRTAVFSASVEGLPDPGLRWQVSTDDGATYTDLPAEPPFSGVFTPELTLTAVTRAMDGWLFRLRASNPEGTAESLAARLTLEEPPDLAEWLALRGVPEDRRGPRDAFGVLGLTNLAAYGMGVPHGGLDPRWLPRVEAEADAGDTVTFVFRLNTDARDVVALLQESGDLRRWRTARPLQRNVSPVDYGTEVREVRFAKSGARPQLYRLAFLVPGESAGDGFFLVPAGTFSMGDPFDEPEEWMASARPVHTVELDEYLIGKTPVTFAQWQTVRAWALDNGYGFDYPGLRGWSAAANTQWPAAPENDDHPVVMISWFDAVKWANARSEQGALHPVYFTDAAFTEVFRDGHPEDGLFLDPSADGYRLPTEAEWERAARGGLTAKRWPWEAPDIDPARANYRDNGAASGTTPVATFPPNNFGLYDMAGNVWEWCGDWVDDDWYARPHVEPNPAGPESGAGRALRGGSWHYGPAFSRTAARAHADPSAASADWGFRLARSLHNELTP